MGWPRLSLASLMGLVAVIALGLTGLFSSSTFWTSVAAALTLALLLGALLGAWLLLGTARAFCLGFALFGIVFFVLVEWDWVGGQFGHDLTSGLLDLGEALIARPAIATPAIATGAPIRVSSEPWAARRFALATSCKSAAWLCRLASRCWEVTSARSSTIASRLRPGQADRWLPDHARGSRRIAAQ